MSLRNRNPSARERGGGHTALDRGRPERFGSSWALGLRADVGISTATGVSQWNDRSGYQANNVAQGTGGLQPVYNTTDAAFKSQPSVQFDGSNDVLSKASVNLIGNYTCTYAIRWTATPAAFQFIFNNWNGTSGGLELGLDASGTGARTINHTNAGAFTDSTTSTSASEVVTSKFTSGAVAKMRVNGADVSVSGAVTTIAASSGANLNIGLRGGGTLPAAAKLAEMNFWTRELNTSECMRHEKYMGARYGIY